MRWFNKVPIIMGGKGRQLCFAYKENCLLTFVCVCVCMWIVDLQRWALGRVQQIMGAR